MHEEIPGSPDSARLSAYFQTAMSRRQLLTGATLAANGTYFLMHWPLSMAQTASVAKPEEQAFLRFSQAITGHRDPDPVTAKRILQSLASASADFPAQLAKLAG